MVATLVASKSLQKKAMNNSTSFEESLLTKKELDQIEDTQLPIRERHHLRLLAHCLACFHSIAGDIKEGPLPTESEQIQWCLEQPMLSKDKEFIPVLVAQLKKAGQQLEELATYANTSPLELKLKDLITSSIKYHHQQGSHPIKRPD